MTARIYGPERWTTHRRRVWSHWDLWFCLLCARECDGSWDVLADRIWTGRASWSSGRDEEAKLSHLDDLRSRLTASRTTAEDLVALATVQPPLVSKARRKVLTQQLSRADLTGPMRDTPRRRLRERAMRGWWETFPVNPDDPYDRIASAYDDQDGYSERASFGVARRLEEELAEELRWAGVDVARQLAVRRAMLTAVIEAMDVTDDSYGMLSGVWADAFPAYLRTNWRDAGMELESYYRDLCELLVWEDYGLLFNEEIATFRKVRAADVDLVARILDDLGKELGRHRELRHQVASSLSLAAYLLVAKRRFDRFVDLAGRLGSDHWTPVVAMAEAARSAGRPDVADAVFDAADRPDPFRERLAERRLRIVGSGRSGAARRSTAGRARSRRLRPYG